MRSVFAVWPRTMAKAPRLLPVLAVAILIGHWFGGPRATYFVLGFTPVSLGFGEIFRQAGSWVADFLSIGVSFIALRILIVDDNIPAAAHHVIGRKRDVAGFALLNVAFNFAADWMTWLLLGFHQHAYWFLVLALRAVWSCLLLRLLARSSVEPHAARERLRVRPFVLGLPIYGMLLVGAYAQAIIVTFWSEPDAGDFLAVMNVLVQTVWFIELTYGAAIYLAQKPLSTEAPT